MRRLGWLVAVCVVAFAAVYLLLVRTPAGQELMDWALIGTAEYAHAQVRRVSRLLHHLSGPVVVALALVILGLGLLRRRPRIALMSAGGFVVAVVLAEVLKRLLPRPLLDSRGEHDLVDKTINTFPSGHVTIVTAFVLALALVSVPRARVWIEGVGSVVVVLVGLGVVIAGWHRPGDSLGGVLLATMVMGVTSMVLVRGRVVEPNAGRARAAVLVSALVSAAAVVLVLTVRQDGAVLPPGVADYALPLTIVVIAGVCFGLTQVGVRLLCVPAANVTAER